MRRSQTDGLEVPNYGYQEAVKYLHIPTATLRYWLRPSVNLLRPADPIRLRFSFKNLVECYVLEGLRVTHHVHLSAIRKALMFMHKEFKSRHPLADYELKTDGQYLYLDGKQLLNLSLQGQLGMAPILNTYLKRIERDFSHGRWVLYPFTRLEHMRSADDKPRVVSMSPNVRFGLPVLSGTRITTAFLASRYRGGDRVPRLARDYGRPEAEIAEAISWETGQDIAA